MERFVEKPNIPASNVRSVLLGRRYVELLADPLAAQGIRVNAVDDDLRLDRRVSAHVDMLAHHLGGSEWVAAPTAERALSAVNGIRVYRSDAELGDTYPNDVALNLLRLGGAVYGKLENACSNAIEHLSNRGIEQVSVRQGYAKCSVCVISERAAITSDKGLAAAMRAHGVDVLEISPNGILLDGYDNGFIGGATGLIAPNKLALTGRLKYLKDAAPFGAFLSKHNVELVELTDSQPMDVGSILPVTEQV